MDQIANYVAMLFVFWSLLPVVLVFVGLLTARKFGVVGSLRGFATVTVPVFAVLDLLGNLIYAPSARFTGSRSKARFVVKVLVPIVILIVGISLNKQGFPVRGTHDRNVAHYIFGFLFLAYLAILIPISFGLPLAATARHLPPDARMALTNFRWSGAMFVGVVSFAYPGEFGWIAALSAIGYAVVLGGITLKAVAVNNFRQAPQVRAQVGHPEGRWYFLHISDVHATFPVNSEPAGGGQSGTARLAAVAASLPKANGGTPRLLIDTGDIIDRGRADEWEAPLKSLRMVKDAGIRVVIAPGNHDLVPTYDFTDAYWAVTSKRFITPELDGTRLFKYFSVASELEPQLRTCHGDLLKDIVNNENKRMADVLGALEFARNAADSELNLIYRGRQSFTRLLYAADKLSTMSQLRMEGPASADRITANFAARAHALYPEWDQDEWRRMVFTSDPQHLEWGISNRIWESRWTDLFPLRLEIAEDEVEILILNSIAKEARLAGSARGMCGERQLERLRKRLGETGAKIVLILNHHAPFRFPIEKNEPMLQRWAMLAHDSGEAITLARLLVEAVDSGKQALLLSGHIHMRSRYGHLVDEKPTAAIERPAAWILESGALGEAITDVLPSGWMTSAGGMEPRLVSRPS
jgi:predicted MPP superfamily phosphohydrolase